MAYTKLFASIVSSTLWSEDSDTRVVWITMLAMADKHGEVTATIPGLARLAGVSLEACEAALVNFLAPDKYSRTETAEGRRIEKIEGGWALINHGKYRRLASKEDSVEKNAERQRRFKKRNGVTVTPGNAQVTQDRDIADTDKNRGAPPQKGPPPPIAEKSFPIAARPPAPEGAASRTPGLASEETWRQRLAAYDPHDPRKTWQPFWGPRPDAPGHQPLIPPDLLRWWREQREQAA